MSTADPPNPVTVGHASPQWAQLTRLAGDRTAILFEELRKRVSTIPGLIEELGYDEVGKRWTPRYRLGEQALFVAHILPAALEAAITLDPSQRDTLLSSRKLSSAMKQLIRHSPMVEGVVPVRVRLNSRAAVRAFSTLVAIKSKLVSSIGNRKSTIDND